MILQARWVLDLGRLTALPGRAKPAAVKTAAVASAARHRTSERDRRFAHLICMSNICLLDITISLDCGRQPAKNAAQDWLMSERKRRYRSSRA